MGCNDIKSNMMAAGGDHKNKTVLNYVLKLTNCYLII